MSLTLRHHWIALTALLINASFLTAHAVEERFRDLSWDEAKHHIRDLDIHLSGEATKTAQIVGFVYKGCERFVQIKAETVRGARNFRVQAQASQLEECRKQKSAEFPNGEKRDESVFVSLFKSQDSRFEKHSGLENYDGEVRLIALNENLAVPAEQVTSFDPPLSLVSKATIARKLHAERQAREEVRHERLLRQAKQCRDSESNNEQALAAIEELVSSGKLDDSEAETLTKSVANSELKILEKRLASINSSDTVAIENLHDDIVQWQERYSDFDASAEIAGRLRMKTAEKMGSIAGSSRAARTAMGIYEDLKESRELPEDMRRGAELAAYDMRGTLVAAEISEVIHSQAVSGVNPWHIQQSLMEQNVLRSYQTTMEDELREACGRFGFFQTWTESGRESFQRCAEIRQRVSTHQAKIAQVIQQELIKAQMTQMEIMRQQQQLQSGQAAGQLGAIHPSLIAPVATRAQRTEL